MIIISKTQAHFHHCEINSYFEIKGCTIQYCQKRWRELIRPAVKDEKGKKDKGKRREIDN